MNSIILCEGETLNDLKNILLNDTIKFNSIMVDYKYYDDFRWEAVNDSIRNPNKINYLNEKASDNIKHAMDILAKIRQTEFTIQKMEPSFKSNIQKQ